MNKYFIFIVLLYITSCSTKDRCQLLTGKNNKDTLFWACEKTDNHKIRFLWKDPCTSIEPENGNEIRNYYLNGYISIYEHKIYYQDIYQVVNPPFPLNVEQAYKLYANDSLLLFDMDKPIGDTMINTYYFFAPPNLIRKKNIAVACVRKVEKPNKYKVFDFSCIDFEPGRGGGYSSFVNRHILITEKGDIIGFYCDFKCEEAKDSRCFLSGWGEICFSRQDSVDYRVGEKYIFE